MPPRAFLPGPEIARRLHYVAWVTLALIALPLLGYSAILLLALLSGEPVEPDLLFATAASGLLLSAVTFAWRKHGERHGRFRESDAALHAFAHASGTGRHRRDLAHWVAAIERADGLERQLVRNQAKAWLRTHAHELDADDRAFAAEHLGYLGGG